MQICAGASWTTVDFHHKYKSIPSVVQTLIVVNDQRWSAST